MSVSPRTNVLLVTADVDLAALLETALERAVSIDWIRRFSGPIKRLTLGDAVVVDLTERGARTLDDIRRLRAQRPEATVVAIVDGDSAAFELETIHAGAQDCLVRRELYAGALLRSIALSVERQRARVALLRASMVDELTGLFNRRGFHELAGRRLALARRQGSNLLVFFLDVDGMKAINDGLGHLAGDRALVATADALRRTFRESDVIARLGGDEFAVLTTDSSDGAGPLLRRLQEMTIGWDDVRISFSVGVTSHESRERTSVEELLDRADQAQYRQKRAKRDSSQFIDTRRVLRAVAERGAPTRTDPYRD